MYSLNKSELLVKVDCDNTLLLWSDPTVPGPEKLTIDFADTTVYLTPHHYHVQLVKMYKMRGYHVTVWSANGWAHAEKVVKALQLDEFVDTVETKPTKHMDDSDSPGSILGPRVFEEDLTRPNRRSSYPSFNPYTDIVDCSDGVTNTVVLGGVLNGR